MNYLAIDYGTKRLGLAVSENGFISTLPVVPNDDHLIDHIQEVINKYQIQKIYVGLSEGPVAQLTLAFVRRLKDMLKLDIETVEEAVSTIEADQIYKQNRRKAKNYKRDIDSVAAAVILNRVIS